MPCYLAESIGARNGVVFDDCGKHDTMMMMAALEVMEWQRQLPSKRR